MVVNEIIPNQNGVPVHALLVNVNTYIGDPELVAEAVRSWKPTVSILEEIGDEWIQQLKPLLASYSHSIARPRNDNFGIGISESFRCVTRDHNICLVP